MAHEYLVRAKLEGPWPENLKLPVKLGDFTLDWSKNLVLLAIEGGWIEPGDPDYPTEMPEEDPDYPMSFLSVDAKIRVDKPDQRFRMADERLGCLEALFKLFRPGLVFVRRHKIEDGKPSEDEKMRSLLPGTEPLSREDQMLDYQFDVRPELAPLYSRPQYTLDSHTLRELIDFFNNYWDGISQAKPPLNVAIPRFSSSYEKWTPGDRLIDLVVALEALFGSKGEVTYKVALRSSCLLYPPGEARQEAFKKIKKVYEERSRILHGGHLDTTFKPEDIDQFEDYVRMAIVKLLELRRRGVDLGTDAEKKEAAVDRYLFFNPHPL